MTETISDFRKNVAASAEKILSTIGDFRPRLALTLGSGLGDFGEKIKEIGTDLKEISYNDLPGFPIPGVEGHAGALLFARVGKTDLVIAQGRAHFYEEGNAAVMKPVIATLKAIGVDIMIATNAAGSLDPLAQPGDVMLITDHINMTGTSPLIGEKGNERFVNMVDAYDPELCQTFRDLAMEQDIPLHQGTYLWTSGPQFETPAEIRAFRILGADAVGMSTVPEVIMARHQGLKIAAFSIITNMAAGMSDETLSHEHTQTTAKLAASKVKSLLLAFFEKGV